MKGNRLHLMIVGCIWLTLAGCAVGPDYKRPTVDAPEKFRGDAIASHSTNAIAELPWWSVFNDERLQALIREALANNYDLRIAATRVEQERALAAQARAGFFPSVNYAANAGRGKNVGPGGSPSPTGIGGTVFSVDANASWEVDLWGRVRRLSEAARAQYFASDEARRDVLISIIAQVAQDYFQLLALDREIEIAKQSTNSFGESLRIFRQRLEGGVASKLETASAEALMDAAAATIPQLERRIAAQENQIHVLLGTNPGPVPRDGSIFDRQDLPEIPPGIPSALLERRPDIREAEQQLRSANAQVGVAVANFFPQLNLTGLFGQASTDLGTLVSGGGSVAWSVASGLAGPIFQGGRLAAQHRQALAARDQFTLEYQAAALNAFREVSDALISREKLTAARREQSRAVDAYREAGRISMERYRLGKSGYYEVLQQQQQLFPAENTLVEIELDQLTNIVQLYRALGGGWK